MQLSPPHSCKIFSLPQKETLYPLSKHSSFSPSPSPWQPVYFLSVWIHLFQIFHIYAVTVYQGLLCLASFTEHVFRVHPYHSSIACISTSLLFMAEYYFTIWVYHFSDLFTRRWTELFPPFSYCESCFYEHSCTCFCV